MHHLEEIFRRKQAKKESPVGYIPPWGKTVYVSSRVRWKQYALFLFLACSFFGSCFYFQRKINKLETKHKMSRIAIQKIKQRSLGGPTLGDVAAPIKLLNVPFADDLGIVIGVQTVSIPNIQAPYNPALVPLGSGYQLFFRTDEINSKAKFAPFYSRIGTIHLDRAFRADGEPRILSLGTHYAEDPRAVFSGGQLYLVCNILDPDNSKIRSICLYQLDQQTLEVNFQTFLDMNLQWVEKNWTPFEYVDPNGKKELFFEYQISPRKILALPDPTRNDLINWRLPQDVTYLSLPWASKWGQIRGGTPCQKIGDEYLGFFHSSFLDKKTNVTWYMMGAYTFEAVHPFRMTRISQTPLLFKGIFDTPILNTASLDKRVIFPSGFAVEKKGERELLHVACGENDSGIKIVTIDKEQLFKQMNPIKSGVLNP